jgi:hypothetical protein
MSDGYHAFSERHNTCHFKVDVSGLSTHILLD